MVWRGKQNISFTVAASPLFWLDTLVNSENRQTFHTIYVNGITVINYAQANISVLWQLLHFSYPWRAVIPSPDWYSVMDQVANSVTVWEWEDILCYNWYSFKSINANLTSLALISASCLQIVENTCNKNFNFVLVRALGRRALKVCSHGATCSEFMCLLFISLRIYFLFTGFFWELIIAVLLLDEQLYGSTKYQVFLIFVNLSNLTKIWVNIWEEEKGFVLTMDCRNACLHFRYGKPFH